MKVTSNVEIYTTQNSKIIPDETWVVDYFDDNKDIVWLKKEGDEKPAGNTYISLGCYRAFFSEVVI